MQTGAQDLEGVAIVGMAGRFPDARNIAEFWQNLAAGRESLHRLSDDQLRGVELDFERIQNDPSYVRARGILADVDKFDAGFFGFSPREAAVLDPQQRVWLETAWHALENAGHAPSKFRGSIGVYAGSYINSYLLYNLCRDREYIERLVRFRSVDAFQNIISNDKDYLPTRTSFKFNLKGPSVNVQTACSTSLVAVAMGCSSLVNFECDLCLAGGVCISFPQEKGYISQEGGMLSPDGHCRPFDENACGTVFSSGVGVVVLRRLEDAIASGDRILAVIRGWGTNNDGALKVSYPAPSVDGQAEVIALAQSVAGVDPETITYVEGHGTATPLGDPIEVAGLTKAFRAKTDREQYCGLGSVKSNIGHLDAAAGVAGLIKTVLALQHGEIPATLHYTAPNPEIDFASSPFYPVEKHRAWTPPEGVPRRAGVSSFGVGGTNVHVVLEEAPAPRPALSARRLELVPLSAKTTEALERSAAELAEAFGRDGAPELPDAAYTLAVGREEFSERLFVVAADAADAHAALREKSRRVKQTAPDGDRSLVYLFPGQGAQHVDMCRALYESERVFRDAVDRGCEGLRPILDLDLRSVLYPTGSEDERKSAAKTLTQTSVTQPALFVIEYALAELWESWGFTPEVMIGHSVGEYTAACLAGVFTFDDALRVLAERARLMQSMPAGHMRAVRLSEEDVAPYLGDGVALAAANAPQVSIVSGSPEAIQAFEKRLSADKLETIPLHTSHAFHSEMMEPVVAPFTAIVAGVERRAPSRPILSTLTGRWLTDSEATDPSYWAQQLRRPVRFSAALSEVAREEGRVFLEVGPSRTLSNSALQHSFDGRRPSVVSSCAHPKDAGDALASILDAVGRLWTNGVAVDWEKFYAEEGRRRVELPGYAFARERHWIDPPPLGDPTRATPSGVTAVSSSELTADAAVPPAAAPTEAEDPGSRKDRIASRIREIFYDLSGIEIGEDDRETTFLEMGLDSLFLTQASAELGQQLGERIKFRQLLEDVTSIEALAEYYDERLPADAFAAPAPVATTPAPAASSAPPAAAPPIAPSEGGDPVDRIAAQLQTIQSELAGLRAQSARSTGDLEPEDLRRPVAQAKLGARGDTESTKGRFGPYAPVARGADGGLTSRQQQHLDALVHRVSEKTAGSKAAAARYRPVQSDPRSVAGFRGAWKELVYQIVTERSKGSRLWDVDGNEYIDITMGFGVNYLGHSPDYVEAAIRAQLERGMEIGPQHELAGPVAERLARLTGMERVSFCNTGSEAVTAALRMARTVTGRDRIAYFAGDYHGVFDEVLGRSQVVRGNLQTLPAAPGIVQQAVNAAMILDYGAPESLEVLRAHAGELAAVLVEPIQSRHPENRPVEFLRAVRQLTEESGTAMIFDEVITGFRVHPGGAQALFGIRGDLATYGKVIGGGLPIGVVAGSAKYMDALDGGMWNYGDDSAPEADMTFFAGTFVRHPLALAAAGAVLEHLETEGPKLQEGVNARTTRFARELNLFFESRRVPIRIRQFSSWFRFDLPSDLPIGPILVYHLIERGIYIREIGQNCFFSTQHTSEEIARVQAAIEESVLEMQAGGFLPESELVVDVPVGSFPLTDGQREIWFASQMGDDASCAYNESFTLKLRGKLDVDALRDAIRQTVERHEGFSLRFSSDGPSQRLVLSETPEWEWTDLSGCSRSKKKEELRRIYDHEGRTPFDLEAGPLLRLHVVKLDATTHHLIGTSHHIVFDGWSAGVFVDEVSVLYSSSVENRPALLPDAGSFLRYAIEEEERRASEAGDEIIRFWKNEFASVPPPLDLPTDRIRPRVRTNGGSSIHHQFDQDVYESFKAFAGERGVTLFAALLATYGALLHRLTGQDDLVVGIPTAGQALAGEQNMIGHCVNLVPVRMKFPRGATFATLLDEVQSKVLDMYENQDVAFGRLLEEIAVKRDPSRLPLIEVIFNVDRDVPGSGFSGLSASIHENPKGAAHFDMFVNLNEGQGSLTVDLDFNTDLYDEATIRRWLSHFECLLESAVRTPETEVRRLPVLTADQRDHLETELNRTTAEFPDGCLQRVIAEQATKTPNATAVVFGESSWTYRELNAEANRLARYLRSIGVGAEDLIGVHLERGPDLVIALLAIHKAGGAYVPLDPDFPAARIEFMLEDSRASVVLSHSSIAADLPKGSARVVCLDLEANVIGDADASDLEPTTGPEHLAYVIYTSGSTGKPKGVQITHRSLVNFLASMAREPGLRPIDGLAAVTTISFDIAALELFLPLFVGAKCILVPSETAADGAELLRLIRTTGATVLQATPVTWRLLIEAGWTREVPLKVLCGGERLPEDLARQFGERSEEVWNMYGPTETTVWSSCHRVHPSDDRVLVGRPIANTELFVLDDARELLPVGAVGELYIGGTGLARGYLGRDELTSEKFVEHPFRDGDRLYRTGDLARVTSSGAIECLRRVDDQVKVRGFRIELGEVESALAAFGGVAEAVASVWEGESGDHRLVAYVRWEHDSLDLGELRAFVRARLPEYMVPQHFVELDEVPRTPNGKVDRRALPPPDGASIIVETYAPAAGEVESYLAQLWSETLRLERVSVRADFFDLGGHSLVAARMLAKAREEFHVDLQLRGFFVDPTIRGLAEYIEAQRYVGASAGGTADDGREDIEI